MALIYFGKLTASYIACIITLHKIQVAFSGHAIIKEQGSFQKASASHSEGGYLSWVASLSPFPMELFPDTRKFQGISVFNHLLPLDHDRQTCLSDSSGLKRLNRGSCHTPKFAPLFSSPITQGSKVFSSHSLLIFQGLLIQWLR